MAMSAEEIESLIKDGIPDAKVKIEALKDDGDHFSAIVISKKFQIVDMPNSRKVHDQPIPTIGGLVILLTIFIHLPFIQLPEKFLLIIKKSQFNL